jgi:hypothetical protein
MEIFIYLLVKVIFIKEKVGFGNSRIESKTNYFIKLARE